MKKLLISLAVMALAACASSPGDDPVQAIQRACADDAAIRPSVTALLAVPGLASPKAIATVTAARVVIDGVCAAPAASDRVRLLQAVTSVFSVYVELKTARAASSPG